MAVRAIVYELFIGRVCVLSTLLKRKSFLVKSTEKYRNNSTKEVAVDAGPVSKNWIASWFISTVKTIAKDLKGISI